MKGTALVLVLVYHQTNACNAQVKQFKEQFTHKNNSQHYQSGQSVCVGEVASTVFLRSSSDFKEQDFRWCQSRSRTLDDLGVRGKTQVKTGILPWLHILTFRSHHGANRCQYPGWCSWCRQGSRRAGSAIQEVKEIGGSAKVNCKKYMYF